MHYLTGVFFLIFCSGTFAAFVYDEKLAREKFLPLVSYVILTFGGILNGSFGYLQVSFKFPLTESV